MLSMNYLSAVRQILNGHHVGNLEELRIRYNKPFENRRESRAGYSLEMMFVSFAADAENKMLSGEDITKAYSIYEIVNPKDMRKIARNILEEFLEFNGK